ncbi:MAG: hypothetical protein R3D30_00655 [Hyphomicrobiales bacterium]
MLNVAANGDVTGIGGSGIRAIADGSAEANPGIGVTVTTGAGTTVSGGIYGIFATNADYGDLTVTANGNVTGSEAIVATNGINGANLYVTIGVYSTVTGSTNGIRAGNLGDGLLTISVDGDVSSTVGDGIQATNSAAGTDTNILTAVGHAVSGTTGIYANHSGTGALTVNASGIVTAQRPAASTRGARARCPAIFGHDVAYAVTGATVGVYAANSGLGATSITAKATSPAPPATQSRPQTTAPTSP